MDEAPSGAAPTPRIINPPPGGYVPAGGEASVTVTTNAPGLPLELLLLSGADPSVALARTDVDPTLGFPSDQRIAIPHDSVPGGPTDYYLAVCVRAGSAAEQYRHVIPVTTRPRGQ